MKRLVKAEWTKFRSVPRWVIATTAGALLAVAASTFFASKSSTNANEAPAYEDQFHFVHQPLTGDGAIVARVASQAASHEWAKAGLLVKESTRSGAPYAALFVTPGHGVRMQANFDIDIPAPDGAAGWLRLVRTGGVVTGYESVDGAQWTQVGSVTLDALPATIEVGLFVASPGVFTVERQFGSTSTGFEPTVGRATFDGVSLEGAATGEWRSDDIRPASEFESTPVPPGEGSVAGDTATVVGSGDITRVTNGDDDAILNSLAGVLITLIVVIVVSVLFMTSEFRKGLIRTTFVADPRRAHVLVAKALVIAAVGFVAGLVAAGGSYVLSRPIYAENGYAAPSYPQLPLSSPTVLRAVVGSGLLLALIAVLSLSLGALFRRGAGAIALLMAALLAPPILSSALPLDVAQWIGRATPAAGLAIQQTRERWDTATSPWAGLGVLAAYAVIALALAVWRLQRRDA